MNMTTKMQKITDALMSYVERTNKDFHFTITSFNGINKMIVFPHNKNKKESTWQKEQSK